MFKLTKLAMAIAVVFCAPQFVAARALSDQELAARRQKARALTNELISSFTYEFELKSLRISKGWFYILNSANVTVKLEAGHYDNQNQFTVDLAEVKELTIRKDQIDFLSQPVVLKIPAERLLVQEFYGRPKIYLQISVLQNGSELFLARPAIALEAANLQRHRRYLLGTDYIQGTDYKNMPSSFPFLIRNGEAEPRTAQNETGRDSAVLVVHRRPVDLEKQKALASQFEIGGRAFGDGIPEFKVVSIKPEAGIILGRARNNFPVYAELALAHPVQTVESINGISPGDCVVGFSGARETVAEVSAPGYVSVWNIIGGSQEKERSSFMAISEVKKVDCNGEMPKSAESKEDDDD